MVSVDDALASVLSRVAPLPACELPLLDAQGLVLAQDVQATDDLPSFPAAVVDGFGSPPGWMEPTRLWRSRFKRSYTVRVQEIGCVV